MKKLILASIALFFSLSIDAEAACNIKGIYDKEDGSVYYTSSHRLYNFVQASNSAGGKTFCSEDEAENAGYKPASKYFSNSTARVVDCIENGSEATKCANYVMGIYKSLDIYDKLCGASSATREQVINAFVRSAKANQKNMDIAKYYGTTNALMDAYPCGGSYVAKK